MPALEPAYVDLIRLSHGGDFEKITAVSTWISFLSESKLSGPGMMITGEL